MSYYYYHYHYYYYYYYNYYYRYILKSCTNAVIFWFSKLFYPTSLERSSLPYRGDTRSSFWSETSTRNLHKFPECVSCFLVQVFCWYQKLAPNRTQHYSEQVSGTRFLSLCHPRASFWYLPETWACVTHGRSQKFVLGRYKLFNNVK